MYHMKSYKLFNISMSTIFLTGIWLLCSCSVNAQALRPDSQHKHEVAVTLGGLYSSIEYDIPQTDSRDGRDISLGLEYTYMFSKNFGFSTGAEYQGFGAKSTTDYYTGAYQTTDFEQESFEFRYTAQNFVEEQQVGFVNIPLIFTYQNQEHGFYIKAGAKIGLPIYSKYTNSYNLETSGFYEQYNVELFDPQFMGFGSFNGISNEGSNIDLNTNYIATFELGVKQPLKIKNLYGGVYLDYGLTDIRKGDNHPVEYTLESNGAGFTSSSILNSNISGEIKTLAFGIKIRYAFLNF